MGPSFGIRTPTNLCIPLHWVLLIFHSFSSLPGPPTFFSLKSWNLSTFAMKSTSCPQRECKTWKDGLIEQWPGKRRTWKHMCLHKHRHMYCIYIYNIYMYIYMHVLTYYYTLRPPGSPSVLSTMLRWVWSGGGLGLEGGFRGGWGGAITFQEAASWAIASLRVGWLSIAAVVTIRFQGGVATLILDRCSCYNDARSLLRCQEGVATLMLDCSWFCREGLLHWC